MTVTVQFGIAKEKGRFTVGSDFSSAESRHIVPKNAALEIVNQMEQMGLFSLLATDGMTGCISVKVVTGREHDGGD